MKRRFSLKRLLWVVVVAAKALPSAAQQAPARQSASQGADTPQSNDLQKQLDQLKQQYEATTRDLQQCIAAGTVVPAADGAAFGMRYQHLEWHGGYTRSWPSAVRGINHR